MSLSPFDSIPESLQQLVMMSLPNVLVLGRNPLSEQGLEELQKLLLLLLGCAVQTLDFDTKAAIASHIQEVTHNQENVVDLQWLEGAEMPPEDLDSLSRSLAFHLKRLVDERDTQFETIVDLTQERDCVQLSPLVPCAGPSPGDSPSMRRTESRQHLSVELADAKAKIRRLRQELYQLLSDARSARAYRDELDALREKALRELKEDNQVLLETRTMLEEQLEGNRSRSDKLHLLEKESLQLKSKIHDLEMERDMDRKRVEELLEENLVLEMAQKQSMDESLHLGWELEQLSKTPDLTEAPQKSLGEEVNELTSSRLLKLEKENQTLLKTVEELRGTAGQETSGKLLRAGQENHTLTLKLKGLEQENKHLGQTVAALRQRCQVGTEARVKDVEKENRLLHESISNESLQKKVSSLSINCEKVSSLEKENSELEADGRRLRKRLDALKSLTFQLEAAEKESSQLEQENLELRRAADGLRSAGAKAAQLEVENRELESEWSQMKRSLEMLKASSKKTERLEVSYQGLDTENQRLQKALENSSKKIHQLEVELQEVETENQTLQRSLEELKISSKRLEQLEQENKSLEQETSQLEKDKKLLEKENKRLRQQAEIRDSKLDDSNQRLSCLEKENRTMGKEMIFFRDSCTACPGPGEGEQGAGQAVLLESRLESTLKSSLEIKEEKICALEARLQESSNLNQQLRQELKTVRKNYEALRQREEEERMMVQSSPLRGGEEVQTISKWEKESHEATRELLKVKDRLIEIERNNATLQAEKAALRTQLKQLETQSSNLQAQIVAVENSTLGSRGASLQAQNLQLQGQQSSVEAEREAVQRDKEELRCAHELLLRDHDKLAALHERQAAEYEALITKHGGLKSSHKGLETQHRELEDRYKQLLQRKGDLEELEKTLKEQQEKMALENQSHQSTANELNTSYHQLLRENETLQLDHKSTKSQLNSATLEHTRLEAEFSKLRSSTSSWTSPPPSSPTSLLSQLKGNLEEENRHLLDQIQTLMLQNRTLLEQTMESKDLFHVEQRQYIDKLNELRRQKEKLEEKIMDQYKFYDPSPPRRRGNWITLKMRKLIKPKSQRERMRTLALTPSRSEYGGVDGFLPPDSQDSSSIGSGSNSLDDTLATGQQHHRSSTLKRLPFMRNRSKDKDKDKAVYRRSMSMNDLLQSIAVAGGPESPGGQWACSSEYLEGLEHTRDAGTPAAGRHGRQRMKELAFSTTAIDCAALTLPSASNGRAKHRLHTSDMASSEDMVGSTDEPRGQSGEFSLSLDQEVWSSSGSSPTQQHARSSHQSPLQPRRALETCGSPAQSHARKTLNHDVLSLQQFLDEGIEPAESGSQENLTVDSPRLSTSSEPPGQRERPPAATRARGILRSASSKTSERPPRSGAQAPGRPTLRKAESTRVRGSAPPRAGLAAQGRAASVSDRLDTTAVAALPRASRVISTAEGSTRRTSIHDMLSKDSRQPVSVDASLPAATTNAAAKAGALPQPAP
ncbi:hypothetical protein CRUP_000528, partial [Coryphaenoides rupestris]